MAAYRLKGGRIFYVEHECIGTRGDSPHKRHLLHNHTHNPVYVARMYYVGDLDKARPIMDEFAYMTDGAASTGGGGASAYVNCPLCGGEGRIVADKQNRVEIKDSFESKAAPETPFR